MLRRLLSLALVLLFLGCALPAGEAAQDGPSPVRVYVDGLLRLRGYDCGGTLYLSAEDVCALFSVRCEAACDDSGCMLHLDGRAFSAPAGSEVYTMDGRYLFCPEGYREIEGRVCFPADVIERLFGLSFAMDGRRADTDTSRFQLMQGGPDYYTVHFHADDLFWLSRILYAEAHWEPLEGMIGVGNVVLNRVASDAFPATIMGVVLDREHRIQFTPVETGEVVAEPDERAVIAACLVLEGYNTVGDSLYFVNPDSGDASWFQQKLTPTVRIGNHQFYS